MTYIVQQIRSTEEGKRPRAAQLAEGQFALNVNSASPGIFLKTTDDTVVKVGGVSVGTEEPLAVYNNEYSAGELWYNTTTGTLNVYDGSNWSSSASAASIETAAFSTRLDALEAATALSTAVTAGDASTLTLAKAYTDDFVGSLMNQISAVTMTNVVDSAQGINVTGRIAAESIALDTGGSLTAAGCSVDFGSATVSFSGASVGGLSGTIRSDIDTYLNTSTVADGKVLAWDASANAGNGDFAWVAQSGGGGLSAEADTLDTVTGRGATTLNDITVGKVYFSNVFATLGDLPSAATYHGMFAHVHSTGHGYFAHNSDWVKLANHADLGTATAANFTFDQSLIPDTNATYDLGSASYKIRHLFLSDNSIKFGDAEIPLSVDGDGDLTFGGVAVMPYTQLAVLTALGVDTHADNAAAAGGGLAVGEVYFNSTTNKLASVTA